MDNFHKRPHIIVSFLFLLLTLAACGNMENDRSESASEAEQVKVVDHKKLLRHVVLFSFNEDTTEEILTKIEQEFAALPRQITEIHSFEWGVNNSPEELNHGLTHCFFVTFLSEEDRAKYLPHPAHQKFVQLIGPYVKDVTVVDYWTE